MPVSKKQKIVHQYLKDVGHSDTAIKHIMNPNTCHRKYSEDDICNGLVLKCMSPKTFEYLRKNKIVPVPSPRTLSKWIKQFSCKPGFEIYM